MDDSNTKLIVDDLLKRQYLRGNEQSWNDLCDRIIDNFIKFDPGLKNYEERLKYIFYNKIVSLNSPALMNLGYTNQCSACFVLDVEDTLESIYSTIKESALLFKSGAGVGLSLSSLREKGSELSSGGESSGVISWMEQFNTMVESVKQGGKRRGALLIALHVSHPDIFDFIEAKSHAYIKKKYNITDDYTANILYEKIRPFSNMNISVVIDDDFLYALKNKLNYNLISPKNKKIVRQISAVELFDKLVNHMYLYGEPGIMFDNRINADNPVPELGMIKSSNPCLTKDTIVKTDEGDKTIEEIVSAFSFEKYFKVYTYSTRHKKIVLSEILFAGKTRENAPIIEVEFESGDKLKLTEDHLIYTLNRGYVQAKDLTSDDIVMRFKNKREYTTTKIVSIKPVGNEDVYDLKVRYSKNFFANNILVHNCSEVLTIPYNACALSTLNMYNAIKHLNISFHEDKFNKDLKEIIYLMVRLTDDIIDINNIPIPKIKENSLKLRPIGIGVMDLAGAMILDGVTYGDNKKCLKYINNFFYNFRKEVIRSSIELAKEKGPVKLPNLTVEKVFKGLDLEKEASLVKEFQKNGIRNSNLLSMPPTGATGLLYEANAGGIEPLFSLKYTRTVLNKTYDVIPKVVFDVSDKQKSLLVTVKDLKPIDHIAVLAEISKFVDMAISKTINFPYTTTINEIKDIIKKVMFEPEFKSIKSLTIYRENPSYTVLAEAENGQNGLVKELPSFVGVIERPDEVEGITSRVKYQNKYIYITVNFYKNRPIEVWLDGGNPGDELNAILWSCGWFISKYLQYGLPLKKMFNKMMNVNSTEYAYSNNGVYSGLINLIFSKIYEIVSKRLKVYFVSKVCPKCNSENFILESGCWHCLNCGFSSCGS